MISIFLFLKNEYDYFRKIQLKKTDQKICDI